MKTVEWKPIDHKKSNRCLENDDAKLDSQQSDEGNERLIRFTSTTTKSISIHFRANKFVFCQKTTKINVGYWNRMNDFSRSFKFQNSPFPVQIDVSIRNNHKYNWNRSSFLIFFLFVSKYWFVIVVLPEIESHTILSIYCKCRSISVSNSRFRLFIQMKIIWLMYNGILNWTHRQSERKNVKQNSNAYSYTNAGNDLHCSLAHLC